MALWYGNAAKNRIIGEIVARANQSPEGQSPLVFDYGAGTGGSWPDILAKHPNIRLVCYEPHRKSAAILANRLRGRATVYEGNIADLNIQADYIVSFSVLEHVADRPAYMANAARLLAPHGRFYLNYDDGHFRGTDRPAEPTHVEARNYARTHPSCRSDPIQARR